MAINHVAIIGGRRVIYLDAREEHLSPGDARRVAEQLRDLADRADQIEQIEQLEDHAEFP